jgi:hypothetical protein
MRPLAADQATLEKLRKIYVRWEADFRLNEELGASDEEIDVLLERILTELEAVLI